MTQFNFGSFVGEVVALSHGAYGRIKEVGLETKSGLLYNIETDINSMDLFYLVGERVKVMAWHKNDLLVVAYYRILDKKRLRKFSKPRRQKLARAN